MKETSPYLIEKIIILNYFYVDWEDFLEINDLKNADNSAKIYLDNINMLLDTYAPLKKKKKKKKMNNKKN